MPTYTPIIPNEITTLSTPPNTGDIANFDTRADTHVQEVVDMVPEINDANDINYNNALAAYESAVATAADVIAVGAIKDLAVAAKYAAVIAQGLAEDAKDAADLSAIDAAASALAAATGGGLPVVPGLVGSVVTWDGTHWVGALPATPSIPTSTGDVVPSGSLLAIDDAGLPMSVDSISTAVIQATASIGAMHAIGLSNGNTAVFWRESTGTDMRMMVIDNVGSTILSSTSVGTCSNPSTLWACQLTNGNIALAFLVSGSAYFKILDTSGSVVVSDTNLSVASITSKVCALSGGGFAIVGGTASTTTNIWVRNNAGTAVASTTFTANIAANYVSISALSSGGFVAMAGGGYTTAIIYNASGTLQYSQQFNSKTQGLSSAASAGNIVLAGWSGVSESYSSATVICRPKYLLSKDNETINAGTGDIYGTDILSSEAAFTSAADSTINSFSSALGNGNFIVGYGSKSGFTYPMVANIHTKGSATPQIAFEESTRSQINDTFHAVPKGQNGFVMVWVASNKNIKMAYVKSGKIIGISLGQVGTDTLYRTSGVATDLTNNNMLNVGGRSVEVTKRGKRVFI